MGSALNNYLTPIIADSFHDDNPNNYSSVGMPMFVGFFAMCAGLICTIGLAHVDRITEIRAKIMYESVVHDRMKKTSTPKRDISQLTGHDLHRSASIKVEVASVINEAAPIATGKEETGGEHINFKDILKLPGSYWLLIMVATLCETLFIPFLDNGNKYYTAVFKGINTPD